MGDLGLWIEGWVFGFEKFGFGDWGREALEKKLGNFDLEKRFAKCNMEMELKGRTLYLGLERD
jgi:hypothetical protein